MAFCYHSGAVVAGFVTPILTYFAVEMGMGFAMPVFLSTSFGLVSFVIAVLPETRGKELVSDLELIAVAEAPDASQCPGRRRVPA